MAQFVSIKVRVHRVNAASSTWFGFPDLNNSALFSDFIVPIFVTTVRKYGCKLFNENQPIIEKDKEILEWLHAVD